MSTIWWVMLFLPGRLWRRRHGLCIEILPFSRLLIHFCLIVGSKVHPLRINFQQWQPIWCLLGLVRECAGVIILLKLCLGSRSLPLLGTLMSVLLPRHMREVWTSRIALWDVFSLWRCSPLTISRSCFPLRWNVNSFSPPVDNKCDTSYTHFHWHHFLSSSRFHCVFLVFDTFIFN